MNNKKFFQDLNEVCHILNEKFNINDGYCYYVAYLLAQFCEKHNIEYKFAAYREPYGKESTIYHYGVKIIDEDIIVNPDWGDKQYYEIQYIKQNSKWMYEQHKQNYKPKLSYYWKDYNKRFVNRELKYLFGKYQQLLKLWKAIDIEKDIIKNIMPNARQKESQ